MTFEELTFDELIEAGFDSWYQHNREQSADHEPQAIIYYTNSYRECKSRLIIKDIVGENDDFVFILTPVPASHNISNRICGIRKDDIIEVEITVI
jgi:hypothetical protein